MSDQSELQAQDITLPQEMLRQYAAGLGRAEITYLDGQPTISLTAYLADAMAECMRTAAEQLDTFPGAERITNPDIVIEVMHGDAGDYHSFTCRAAWPDLQEFHNEVLARFVVNPLAKRYAWRRPPTIDIHREFETNEARSICTCRMLVSKAKRLPDAEPELFILEQGEAVKIGDLSATDMGEVVGGPV